MRIKNDDDITIIYVSNYIIKDYKYLGDERETKEIVDILLKISNIYNLIFKGLYKINVYQNKKLGIILEIIKYDDLDIIDYTDFKIEIYNNYPFLIEFDDYFDVPNNYKYIRYNDKYYLHIEDIANKDLLKYSDMYKIIYKNIELINDKKAS